MSQNIQNKENPCELKHGPSSAEKKQRFSGGRHLVSWSYALQKPATLLVAAVVALCAGCKGKSDDTTDETDASVHIDSQPDGELDAYVEVDGEVDGEVEDQLLPFNRPPLSELQASEQKVVAHWMLWPISADNQNPESDHYARILNTGQHTWDSHLRYRPIARPPRDVEEWQVADFKAEIRIAQAVGLDAFLVNIFPRERPEEGALTRTPTFFQFLTAAEELGTDFKIAPNFDFVGGLSQSHFSNATLFVESIVEDLDEAGMRHSPSLMRKDGKIVVGSFYIELASPEWLAEFCEQMAANDLEVFFIGLFNSIGTRGLEEEYKPVFDGWSDWGARTPDRANRNYNQQFPTDSGIIMAAINYHDVRYRPTYSVGGEAAGSRTLRNNWMSAINSGTDWAQLVTWNDHGEHSSFIPNTGVQFAVNDITAYYITWFKTGSAPQIKRDALYYFHRIQQGPPWINHFGSLEDMWINEIELVGFLVEPGTLEIITDEGVTQEDVEAGIQSITAPLPEEGRPQFRLVRDGEVVIDIHSAFVIGERAGGGESESDMVYRAGGSLRMLYGTSFKETPPPEDDPDAYLDPMQGEPVWLAQ